MMALLGRLTSILTREKSSHPYECQTCGKQFSVQYHCCPACGGYSIDRRVWQTTTDQ